MVASMGSVRSYVLAGLTFVMTQNGVDNQLVDVMVAEVDIQSSTLSLVVEMVAVDKSPDRNHPYWAVARVPEMWVLAAALRSSYFFYSHFRVSSILAVDQYLLCQTCIQRVISVSYIVFLEYRQHSMKWRYYTLVCILSRV
jgi:hypothetical protein